MGSIDFELDLGSDDFDAEGFEGESAGFVGFFESLFVESGFDFGVSAFDGSGLVDFGSRKKS